MRELNNSSEFSIFFKGGGDKLSFLRSYDLHLKSIEIHSEYYVFKLLNFHDRLGHKTF